MSETGHTKKVPPPFTATTPNPGARNLSDPDWVRKYREYICSLPQVDYSKGSGSGHNNGS